MITPEMISPEMMAKTDWTPEMVLEAAPEAAALMRTLLACKTPDEALNAMQKAVDAHQGAEQELMYLFLLAGPAISNGIGIEPMVRRMGQFRGEVLPESHVASVLRRCLISSPVVNHDERTALDALGRKLFFSVSA